MSTFYKTSLKTIFALLSILNLLALGALGVTWQRTSAATETLKSVSDQRYQSYLLADELRQSSDDLTRLARTYAVTGDPRYEAQYLEILDIRDGKKPRPQQPHRIYWDFVAADGRKPRPDGAAKPLLTLMKEAGFSAAELQRLETAKANSDNLVNLEVKAMNAVKGLFADASGAYTKRGEADLKLARELTHSADYHRFKADIMRPVDDFFRLLDERTNSAVRAAEARVASLEAISTGLMLLAGLILLGSGTMLFARVMRPLGRMAATMKQMASGDMTTDIPGLGRGDEIGSMAAAVDVFRTNSLELDRVREEQMQAKEESERRRRIEMADLAARFESAVGNIIHSVSQSANDLEKTAGALTETARNTQALSSTVASASEQASANVRSVAAATDEMSASVAEIARQLQDGTRIANEAVGQAHQTDARITQLSQAAQRIGDVVKLITAIAEQTNLLALNATIEAARAGDAGRGFAVVAQEVKALAAQTAKATEEIGTQIAGMQTATAESVAAIQEIGGTIGRISQITDTISAAVEQQGAATKEISRNVQQAAAGTSQVAGSIADVNQGAGATGVSSTQVLASAQHLAGEGGRLKGELERFLDTVRAA